MSKSFHPVTTRAQREAILRLFIRCYGETEPKLVYNALSPVQSFPGAAWRSLYRQYRKRFQLSGFAGDYYLFGQPFETGDGQMYVGIESDGYTHS